MYCVGVEGGAGREGGKGWNELCNVKQQSDFGVQWS